MYASTTRFWKFPSQQTTVCSYHLEYFYTFTKPFLSFHRWFFGDGTLPTGNRINKILFPSTSDRWNPFLLRHDYALTALNLNIHFTASLGGGYTNSGIFWPSIHFGHCLLLFLTTTQNSAGSCPYLQPLIISSLSPRTSQTHLQPLRPLCSPSLFLSVSCSYVYITVGLGLFITTFFDQDPVL